MDKPTVYTTPSCVYCKMVKAYFEEKGIEFDEKDVAADEKARNEMIQKSGQMGVPVAVIGDQVVVGFDKGTLEMILAGK